MSALGSKLSIVEPGGLMFWCAGCEQSHLINVGDGPGPRWSFNGDGNRPTFSPSVLVKAGHFCQGQEGKDCWCTYEARLGKPSPFKCFVCHSFVTDGRIQYLGDCTHALAGQTIDLPDWPRGE